MKIRQIEACDMGTNQHEIAEWVENYVADKDFSSKEEFYDQEFELIELACAALNWHSVPQNGGLQVEWMYD